MKLFSVFLPSILILLMSSAVNANTQLDASEAFDEMKSLVGVWKKEGKKSPNFSVIFELTANNSVLVEAWLFNDKKHSFTMYHLDNEKLIATHYCPQGNQPRLALSANSTINRLRFEFFDATNLANLSHSHQHSLGFEFSHDNNKMLRKESYLNGVKEDFSELQLVRNQ
ncbi:hypothetical protein [uncultured Shewanella sp.]|uniref:hypothetical protein n=1 Tax=uncultured Shewanella sp. TaxID=173975 RepID=UPI0026301EB1|nr:hypothetical protein [uncultured Shewanella sp.]